MNITKPVKIFRRLRSLALVLHSDLKKLGLLREASAMSFTTLLSIVPSLVVFFSCFSLISSYLISDYKLYFYIKDFVLKSLTMDSSQEILNLFDHYISTLNVTTIGLSGFCVFLVTIVLLLRTIELTFNKIWGVQEGRSLFIRTFRFLGFFILVTFSLSLLYSYSLQLEVKANENYFFYLINVIILNFRFKIVIYFLLFFCCFKWIPNCSVKVKNALIGALISSFLFFFMTKFFSFYVFYAKQFNAIYGILAGVPLFLFWLFICWIVILLGVLICWRTQYGIWSDSIYDQSPFRTKEEQKLRFKSLLPLMILLILYEQSAKDNAEALSGHELKRILNIPSKWLVEALIRLSECAYLNVTVDELQAQGERFLDLSVSPLISADKVMISKLSKDFLVPVNIWLKNWKNTVSKETMNCFNSILKTHSSSAMKKLTLNSLFLELKEDVEKEALR